MTTPHDPLRPNIPRALRRAIQFCERMAQVSLETQPRFKEADRWRTEAAQYRRLLATLKAKRKDKKT